jgi:hypothetical protein
MFYLSLRNSSLVTQPTQQRADGLRDNPRTPLRGWRWFVSDEHRDCNTRPEEREELHRCELGIPCVGPSR